MEITPEYIASLLDEDLTSTGQDPAVAGADQAVGLDAPNQVDAKNMVNRQNQLQQKRRQEQQKKLNPLQAQLRAKRAAQQRTMQQNAQGQEDMMNAQNDYVDQAVQEISKLL